MWYPEYAWMARDWPVACHWLGDAGPSLTSVPTYTYWHRPVWFVRYGFRESGCLSWPSWPGGVAYGIDPEALVLSTLARMQSFGISSACRSRFPVMETIVSFHIISIALFLPLISVAILRRLTAFPQRHAFPSGTLDRKDFPKNHPSPSYSTFYSHLIPKSKTPFQCSDHAIDPPLLLPPISPAISSNALSASISPEPRLIRRRASASRASKAHRSACALASSSPPQPQTSKLSISNRSWKLNLRDTEVWKAPPREP